MDPSDEIDTRFDLRMGGVVFDLDSDLTLMGLQRV